MVERKHSCPPLGLKQVVIRTDVTNYEVEAEIKQTGLLLASLSTNAGLEEGA